MRLKPPTFRPSVHSVIKGMLRARNSPLKSDTEKFSFAFLMSEKFIETLQFTADFVVQFTSEQHLFYSGDL